MDGAGDYVFVREIGHGVHGRVFLARPPARVGVDDDHVAVKVISGHATAGGFEAVVDELLAYAGVDSQLLLPLYDVGMDGGTVFYAMHYSPFGSLAAPARDVPRRERLVAVARAARAVHELHEAGIAHRAIQPSNVLLDSRGALLAEPAVAHLIIRGEPLTGVGTRGDARDLEFVDPALMKGGRAGRASDVWSLGVTLHMALTGFGLYPALTSADPMVAVRIYLRSRPEPDSKLSDAERAIVVRALHRDPALRYPTAEAFAEDVERVLR
jgi:serine/threonine-protein kinase